MTDDRNPERLRLTEEVRQRLNRLDVLERDLGEPQRVELAAIRHNISEYLDWNEVDAQAVRQNTALRNDETGERR